METEQQVFAARESTRQSSTNILASQEERPASTLLTLFGRRGLRGDELTPAEAQSLRAQAYGTSERVTRQLCHRLQSGDVRGARRKVRWVLTAPAPRLWAACEADRRYGRKDRPMPFAELILLAQEIDLYARPARPHTFHVPKRTGSAALRELNDFGLADRAASILIELVLKAFARVHPTKACLDRQYLLNGGSGTAGEHLREALRSAGPDSHFVQIDVAGFYSAIGGRLLARITGLPEEVARNHLLRRRTRKEPTRILPTCITVLQAPTTEQSATPHAAGGEDARRRGLGPGGGGTGQEGIFQGSAAACVAAEMVMGQVLRGIVPALADVLWLGVYSDNIGVLAPSRGAALVIKEALQRHLEDHEAGPFPVGRCSVLPILGGFEFLGYRWQVTRRCEVVASPPPMRLWRKHMEWDGELLTLLDPERLYAFRKRVVAYFGQFKLWARRDEVQRRWEKKIVGAISHAHAMQGHDIEKALSSRDQALLAEYAADQEHWAERRSSRLYRPAEQPRWPSTDPQLEISL